MVLEPVTLGAWQHLEPSHEEGMAISPAAQANKGKGICSRAHELTSGNSYLTPWVTFLTTGLDWSLPSNIRRLQGEVK